MKPESAEKAEQRKMTTLTSAGQSGGAAARRNSGKGSHDGGGASPPTSHPLSSPPVGPPTPQPKPVTDSSSKPSSSTARRCCPYCGTVTAQPEGSEQPCPRCTIEDTPATRAATKARIGPWFVLQSRNPSAPGMRWTTLMELIATGQVTARSIVRGPTTHQFWKFADKVKGLSREFGVCYHCGGSIDRTVNQCPTCERIQEPPLNPDALLENPESAGAWRARTPATLADITITPRDRTTATAATAPRQAPPPPDAANEIASSDFQADPRGETSLEPRRLGDADGAGAGDRTTEWHPDPAILSAKELAAAFKLDFQPQPQRRRSRAGVAIALLVLFALAGAAAVLYVRPEYRERLTQWVEANWPKGKTHETVATAPPTVARPPTVAPSAPREPNPVTSRGPDSVAPRDRTTSSDLAASPSAATQPAAMQEAKPSMLTDARPNSPPTAPVETSRSSPAPSATTLPSPMSAAAPLVQDIVQQAKALAAATPVGLKLTATTAPMSPMSPAAPAPARRDAAPPASAPSPNADADADLSTLTEDQAVEQARTLWGKAIDAERKHDYAAAVRQYEQIKRLPRDVWPAALDIRLNNARRNAGK